MVRAAAAQQADYPAELVSGSRQGVQEGTTGRLVLADTALFFTQRNGQPILVLPFGSVSNAYTVPTLGGGVAQTSTASDRYLVVVTNREGQDQSAVIFSAPPPSADELSAGILAGLDARRVSLYAPKSASPAPQVARPPYEPPVRSQPAPAAPAAPLQPSRGYRAPPAQAAPPTLKPAKVELEEGDPGYKDPGTATLLSLLIAGGGQIYAGESGSGFFYLFGSLAAIGIGAGLTQCDFSCDYTPLYVGAGVALLLDLVSLADASPAAHRHNRKLAAKRAAQSFSPYVLPTSSGTTLGMRISIP
jgi:hypothetical protein